MGLLRLLLFLLHLMRVIDAHVVEPLDALEG
jgi:hypothetical protein